RFYDTLTQGEIAQRLGVSQMSVSRKLTRLLTELRTQTTDDKLALAG
ncbi:sigma factor-like helix-turn-helix DNA-binding protein, partial [Nocardia salmonicida]